MTHVPADYDAGALAAARRRRGLGVTVIVPARDEAATVGEVVRAVTAGQVGDHGLVDEVVVVDGGSTDGTVRAARRAGARVVHQGRVLPEAGDATGKGEALWKGLAATDGDLVVFVDADARGVDPSWLIGLLGPLVADPAVGLVKAAYDRPLRLGADSHPGEGGRVNALVARPLLRRFWPRLAWLAQPLAGEYAGRRDLLEAVPFVQGYGVELAMLVDVLAAAGPGAITEVDLGTRGHSHQPLADLERMADELLAVALDRLAAAGRVPARLAPDRGVAQRPPLADGRARTSRA